MKKENFFSNQNHQASKILYYNYNFVTARSEIQKDNSGTAGSRLRIWCCHCCGLGPYCGTGLTPGPGTSTCYGHGQKKKDNSILWLGEAMIQWQKESGLINFSLPYSWCYGCFYFSVEAVKGLSVLSHLIKYLEIF